MTIKLYMSEHCTPCQLIKEAIKEGKITPGVEAVDIESEEGFAEFTQEVLSKTDGAVPSAYRGGQKCQILLNDETGDVQVVCPDEPSPAPVTEPQP